MHFKYVHKQKKIKSFFVLDSPHIISKDISRPYSAQRHGTKIFFRLLRTFGRDANFSGFKIDSLSLG